MFDQGSDVHGRKGPVPADPQAALSRQEQQPLRQPVSTLHGGRTVRQPQLQRADAEELNTEPVGAQAQLRAGQLPAGQAHNSPLASSHADVALAAPARAM
jgi:hypothetical protein